MRLILALPSLICVAIGSYGYGYSISRGQDYIITAVYLAFLNAGVGYGVVGAISYGISAYPARGGDTFGIIMYVSRPFQDTKVTMLIIRLIKAIYAWSATLYLTAWFTGDGYLKWFSTMGSTTIVRPPVAASASVQADRVHGVLLLAIPMWFVGKRSRAWIESFPALHWIFH
jgi:hypothetical protein